MTGVVKRVENRERVGRRGWIKTGGASICEVPNGERGPVQLNYADLVHSETGEEIRLYTVRARIAKSGKFYYMGLPLAVWRELISRFPETDGR